MKLYNCKVRLHANPNDEVRRRHVTAAEVRVLRKLHGEDAVIEISEAGETDRNHDQERDRLAQAYGEKVVTSLFGVPIVKIETEITDPMAEIEAAPAPEPEVPIGQRVKLPEDLPPPPSADKQAAANLFE
jgi:hypothetical protein